MVLDMQSSESTVNGSTVQSPIVDIILQLPCILTCTLKACILAHFRSLGINYEVESRVPNPNTAPIIFSVTSVPSLYKTEQSSLFLTIIVGVIN